MINSDVGGGTEALNTKTKIVLCSLRSHNTWPVQWPAVHISDVIKNFRFLDDNDADAFLSTHIPPPPACFPPNDLSVWIEWCYYSWRHSSKQSFLDYYCEDCNPDYQFIMRGCGRCAYPGAIQVWRWMWYDGKQEHRIHGINGEYQIFMARPNTHFYSSKRSAEVPNILDEIMVMQEIAREF